MGRWLARKDRQGLTYRELSRASGVPISTLQWWRQQLRKSRGSRAARRAAPPVRFVEATLPAPDLPQGRYEVTLAGGRGLSLPPGFDPAAVRALVTILEAPC